MPSMPVFRNPFRKAPLDIVHDEAVLAVSRPSLDSRSSTSSASGLKSDRKEPPVLEYKLSDINDSGVYLPPSPTIEKRSFWSTRSSSSNNTSRTAYSEHEPFSISRESFDSYRRSFDISARSPVLSADMFRPKHSLDARRARLPVSALPLKENHFNLPDSAPEEFEEVGLNDEQIKPKKQGFLSRLAGNSSTNGDQSHSNSRPSSSHHGLNVFGRKRGTSGQGAELQTVESVRPAGLHDIMAHEQQQVARSPASVPAQ